MLFRSQSLPWEMVFHLISVSPGSGNDARGFPQGQVARDHVGRQPSNVGELFDGAEAQLALRVRVVGLGTPVFLPRESPWTKEPGVLQPMGSELN